MKYTVTTYYSGYIIHEVEADSEDEAEKKAIQEDNAIKNLSETLEDLQLIDAMAETVTVEDVARHDHVYESGRSESIVICRCGKFKFTEAYLRANPPIAGVERDDSNEGGKS